MSRAGILSLLLAAGALASPCARACECVGVYNDPPINCSSTSPPCQSSYYPEYVSYGCTWGEGYSSGTGLCCDRTYYTYNVNTDGCSGHEGCTCGDDGVGRSRFPAKYSLQNAQTTQRSPMSSRDAAHSQEAVLFVPDRCRHGYGVAYPQ